VRGIGVGRVVIGAAFLVSPVTSTRVLGLDSATAKRITFLARMAAARDISLGVGTLSADSGSSAAQWLLAGAAADVVDAAVLVAALRRGVVRGLPAVLIAAGALGSAALAVRAATALRR
jgi:hypothetical protein